MILEGTDAAVQADPTAVLGVAAQAAPSQDAALSAGADVGAAGEAAAGAQRSATSAVDALRRVEGDVPTSSSDEPSAGVVDSVLGFATDTWEAGVDIWLKGGWAMIPLALICFFLFAIGFNVWRRLNRLGVGGLDDATWRRWIHEPDDREGVVGEMFDHVDEVAADGRATIHDGFDEVRIAEVEPFERDLKLMKVAVGAAPLVGLLGTVTGMLATFAALSSGSGGDQTMEAIASGISEALYTTETGLIVALPGLFFHYFLSRRFERFRVFLEHAESTWAKESLEARVVARESEQKERVRALVVMELKRRVMARLTPARA